MKSISEKHSYHINRISIVDFLRGFALLGVVISNFMAFQNQKIHNSGNAYLLKLSEEFFFGPVWVVLSFLFGFGFWTLIYKRQNHFRSFLNRMFWLFVLGILNACIFHIDILRDFAVVGIFLFITPYLSRKKLFITAILMTVFIPFLRAYTTNLGFTGNESLKEITPLFMSNNIQDVVKYNLKFIYIVQIKYQVYSVSVHFEMFCFFLWGVLANRWRIFEKNKIIYRLTKNIMVTALTGIILIKFLNRYDPYFMVKVSEIYNLKIVEEILCALFTFSFLTQIYLSGILKRLFALIEIYGRMTLTNYLAQSVFSLLIFSGIGLGLGRDQPLWIYFLVAVLTYMLQLVISFYWSTKYQLGPVEWIWRSLSAGKMLPILKK